MTNIKRFQLNKSTSGQVDPMLRR